MCRSQQGVGCRLGKENVVHTKMQILIIMRKTIRLLFPIVIVILTSLSLSSCDKDNEAFSGPDTGTGGSLARFTITLNHLYVVDNKQLHTFSISDPQNPIKVHVDDIGFDVETIYTWKDKLFIGSQSAMYIYSIADPGQPSLLGSASHVRACDPVVANDSIAYVTVRSGSNCGGDRNALYVYNLKNVLQPTQMNVVNLQNPHGLGIQDSTLFVCDDSYGLRVYNINQPYYPIQIQRIEGETFYDCIPNDNLLICMIKGGMAIYDISDRNNIVLKAKITE